MPRHIDGPVFSLLLFLAISKNDVRGRDTMHSFCLRSAGLNLLPALLAAGLLLPVEALRAQPMQPGEAFVTRFSGTATSGPQGDQVTIDTEGTVGSIIDVRSPGQPPQGHHWIDEPQRQPLKASEVGQVFGVALDGENPPNIYVTATPAFGLHRTPDNANWMPGMWGPGGPGAVYKLDRANGYRPSLFARIGVANRPNTGASLGNIAYDRWNQQFFVSDLETGMIHRLRAADGADLGVWDHGAQGRTSFLDVEGKQTEVSRRSPSIHRRAPASTTVRADRSRVRRNAGTWRLPAAACGAWG
jgi:hypothetical protein